ncbi:hypothetical protein JRO89_XS07G0183300 [Xanthoceras sorbifolium]|uniref:Kinesin motor domain-containing protein n=1 Tax=Xanthoceras sorbifolium TaxID=99658 RepID=A0ABQ8HU55_9ROSI|nr:hypothetical protein JRO89_XS07G0183300 [Xanthoceras sorbifolium]
MGFLLILALENEDTFFFLALKFLLLQNLIDLAGSESSKTETTGLRRKEGSYINKSLLTLGTVISKLTDGKATHVPYRDSKLTRLLQSSLSGHGRVSLICTVTPASSNSEETHNTLKFAHRSKHVEIKASQNKIMDEKSLIKKYQNEISCLKQELLQLKRGMMENPYMAASTQEDLVNLKLQLEAGQVKLQSRLEEEEQAKAALMGRIQRLTKLILVSTKNSMAPSIPERPGHRRRHSFGEDELAYLPDRKREYMIDDDGGSYASELSVETRDDVPNLDELVNDYKRSRRRGMLGWFKMRKPENLVGLSLSADNGSCTSGSPASSSKSVQNRVMFNDMKVGGRKSISKCGDDSAVVDLFPERTQAGELFSATVVGLEFPSLQKLLHIAFNDQPNEYECITEDKAIALSKSKLPTTLIAECQPREASALQGRGGNKGGQPCGQAHLTDSESHHENQSHNGSGGESFNKEEIERLPRQQALVTRMDARVTRMDAWVAGQTRIYEALERSVEMWVAPKKYEINWIGRKNSGVVPDVESKPAPATVLNNLLKGSRFSLILVFKGRDMLLKTRPENTPQIEPAMAQTEPAPLDNIPTATQTETALLDPTPVAGEQIQPEIVPKPSSVAEKPTGTTITDQMDLLYEQVKMLAGEVALCTSSLKRLSERAASNPENSQLREHMQKLKDEINEKKLQIHVLEQRMIVSVEMTPHTSSTIEMSQALSKLTTQLNEKTFELEIKSADNRILQEQLQMKMSENEEMQQTILLLRQQINSLLDKRSCGQQEMAQNEGSPHKTSSEELSGKKSEERNGIGSYEEIYVDERTPTSVMSLNRIFSQEDSRNCNNDGFLNPQVLMQAAEIENLKQEKVKLSEEKDGLEIQCRKLAEEASYAKELASSAAVELRNLAEEVTRLSYENAKLTGELAAGKEAHCRSSFYQRSGSHEFKQNNTNGARPDVRRKLEDGILVDDLQKELSVRYQREAALQAALSEREQIEGELQKRIYEAKQREEI